LKVEILNWTGILAFLLIVLGPVLALGVSLVQALGEGQIEWLQLAVPHGRRLSLLVQSLGLAAADAIAGVFLGLLVSIFLMRWKSGHVKLLRWFLLILAPVPPYIHALAWSSLAFRLGSWLGSLGLPELPFRGWFASWWVQFMALAPIAISLVLIGLELVDTDLIEASRLLCPDIRGLTKVIIPLASPAILAGGGFLFLLSLLDYSVPSLFHFNVYALDIFAEYSASNQPARAFLLSVPLLIVAIFVVGLSQGSLRNAALKPPWRRRVSGTSPTWPRWFKCLQGLGVFILVLQIFVPLISQVTHMDSWQNFRSSISSAGKEIAFSTRIAILSAIACLPLSFPIANKLLQKGKNGWIWWLLVTIPLAIPAPLIGIGLISIWNQPGLGDVYRSGMMPVMASLARFAPLAAIVLLTQLRRIDPSLIEAAEILQTNQFRTWIRVKLPMLAPGMLAAASITFILSVGELAATLLVAPPGQATLTMRIYNFLHYGASDTVASLCLMITVMVFLFGVFAVAALAGWSRLTSSAN